MKLKNELICLMVLCSLMVGGVVQATDYPIEITDDLDKQIIVKKQPDRIVSLAPSHTETLFAVGLKNNIVGVTKHANYPQAAAKIKKVGSVKEPNIEQIIKLKPDLVLAAGITPKKVVNRLQKLNITVIGLNPQTVKGIIEDISLIGKVTGQDQEATKLTTEMKTKLTKITKVIDENVATDERPQVFYEVWKDPLYTAGSNTFVDNMISLAGGVNIAHDAQGKWPQYSFEVLLAKNPEVYLSSKHSWKQQVSQESIQNREKFQEIKAIKEGRICVLNPDVVNRAGPRIVTALEKIAKAIHPELF